MLTRSASAASASVVTRRATVLAHSASSAASSSSMSSSSLVRLSGRRLANCEAERRAASACARHRRCTGTAAWNSEKTKGNSLSFGIQFFFGSACARGGGGDGKFFAR